MEYAMPTAALISKRLCFTSCFRLWHNHPHLYVIHACSRMRGFCEGRGETKPGIHQTPSHCCGLAITHSVT